jgi:hypothetical protein
MAETVVGIFRDWEEAHAAVRRLREAGFPMEDINVLAADVDRARELHTEALRHQEEGLAIGAATGGALGAAGGFMIGLASLTVPGIGPIFAAGPILGALAGLAAGAGAGGLIGALIGAGIPEEETMVYQEALGRGEILVSVAKDGRGEAAAAVLEGTGAAQVLRPGSPEERRLHRAYQDRAEASEEARARRRHDGRPRMAPDEADVAPVDPEYVAGTEAPPLLMPNERPMPLAVPGAHTAGVLPGGGYTGGEFTNPEVDARLISPTTSAYEGAGPGEEISTLGLDPEERERREREAESQLGALDDEDAEQEAAAIHRGVG